MHNRKQDAADPENINQCFSENRTFSLKKQTNKTKFKLESCLSSSCFFCFYLTSPSKDLTIMWTLELCWFPSKRYDRLVKLRAFFLPLSFLFFSSLAHGCIRRSGIKRLSKPTVATLLSVREVRQEGGSGCKETHSGSGEWAPGMHHSSIFFFKSLLYSGAEMP